MNQSLGCLRAEAPHAGRVLRAVLPALALCWVAGFFGLPWRWVEGLLAAGLCLTGVLRARREPLQPGAFALWTMGLSLGLSAVCMGLWVLLNLGGEARNLFQQVYAARGYTVRLLSAFLSFVWNGSLFLFSRLLGAVGGLLWRKRPLAVLLPGALLAAFAAADGLLRLGVGFWLLYGSGGFCPWCGIRTFALGAAVLLPGLWLLTRPRRRDTICIKAKQR